MYLFSSPTPLNKDEPYQDYRYKEGKSFLAGKRSEKCFSTFEYRSDDKLKNNDKKKNQKKRINQQPWRGTTKLFKSTTYEHLPEYHVVQKGEKPKKKKQIPRNFVTSPPKKGGFGQFGFTLGENYIRSSGPDPYDTYREKLNKEKKEYKKKKIHRVPFRSSGRKRGFFTPLNQMYSPFIAPVKGKKRIKSATMRLSRKNQNAWKPGGGTVKRPDYEYIPEPYDKEKKKVKKKINDNRPSFKPTNLSKTGPVRSCMFRGKGW